MIFLSHKIFIMGTQITLSRTLTQEKRESKSIFALINQFINKEKRNSVGICAFYMTVGTAIASITVGFSVFGNLNLFVYMTAITLAMLTNVSALSLQSFKTTTWLFISSVVINVMLLSYQLIQLWS